MISSYDLNELLALVVTERAERLSLHPGECPLVHLGGERHPVEGPSLTAEVTDEFARALTTSRQTRELRETRSLEFIYTFRDSTTFIVQASLQADGARLDLHRVAG